MVRFTIGLLLVGCGSVQSDNPSADAPDVQVDAPAPPMPVTMTELRALPDGPVNVALEPSRVTYLRNRNIHLQATTVGPAISMFVPAGVPLPMATIGNTIELHVTELTTFEGNKQITKATLVSNDDANTDVSGLIQTLVTAPNEDLESELVKIARGTVVQIVPPNTFQIRLTSNATLELFSPVGAIVGLCVGATFDVTAVVTEFMGRHEVTSVLATDYANVDRTACP
jgi:hypothetical protein